MKHVIFGPSGLRVSELCLGAITFGDSRSFGTSPEESRAMLRAFADAGGTFIDSAHLYAGGESERLIGEFVRDNRDGFVISTKYTPARTGGVQSAGNGRKNMMRCVEESLRRLGTDHIDVYWLHARDGITPWDEIMRGFDDLVRAGKVLYVGVSDTPAWEIARANMLAELRGWTSFIGIQIEYSLVERTPERELLPMARTLGLGVTSWAPLAAGALTGKYGTSGTGDEPTRLSTSSIPPRTLQIAREVAAVAIELGTSPSRVALAWLRQQTRFGRVVPIVGARTAAQLEDNLQSVGLTLESEHWDRLDSATRIDLGFPHAFLASPMMDALLTGGAPEQLLRAAR